MVRPPGVAILVAVASIDLNADLGESDDPRAEDLSLLKVVTSVSIACGGHAGNRRVMRALCAAAVDRGVVVGAHPSYPDRPGFGRRRLQLPLGQLRTSLLGQLDDLLHAADEAGATVRFVKPHGALYNDMAADPALAAAVAAAAAELHLPLLVLADSPAVGAARDAGTTAYAEGFADRGYLGDGRLLPRGETGAVLHDGPTVAAQAVRIATEHRVAAADTAGWAPVHADSLCLHSDTPGAVQLAATVRRALADAGVDVAAFVR